MPLTYFKYGADILQDILFRGGELTALTGSTSQYLTRAKGYIQRVYHDIVIGAPWPWALKDPPGTLNIVAKQTGNATATQDSTSVTFDDSISPTVAGYWLEIDGKQVPYRISSHTAGSTSLTLDATYKESSVSSGACTIYKDEYSLADDCWKIWKAWDRNNPHRIVDIIQQGEMHEMFTSRAVSSTNTFTMALVKEDKVRITPWPSEDDITIEYEYTERIDDDLAFDSSSDDVPIVPLNDRHILSDAALVLLMIDKNDQRASEIGMLVESKFQRMINTYISVGRFRRYVKPGQSIG